MHPELKKIAEAIDKAPDGSDVGIRFALRCVEDVASNLEDEEAISALHQFRAALAMERNERQDKLQELALSLNNIASHHPGSKSIDGTRHAAVSATYALAKAVSNRPIEAAAYAAYSFVYGYGGYAVNDPDSFAEIHQKQMTYLNELLHDQTHAQN